MKLPEFKKYYPNQQGIAHLLLIILVLVGVILAVILVQQKTNIFPHAQTTDAAPQTAFHLIPDKVRYTNESKQASDNMVIHPGEEVSVNVAVSSDIDPANTFSSAISFPADLLEVVSIVKDPPSSNQPSETPAATPISSATTQNCKPYTIQYSPYSDDGNFRTSENWRITPGEGNPISQVQITKANKFWYWISQSVNRVNSMSGAYFAGTLDLTTYTVPDGTKPVYIEYGDANGSQEGSQTGSLEITVTDKCGAHPDSIKMNPQLSDGRQKCSGSTDTSCPTNYVCLADSCGPPSIDLSIHYPPIAYSCHDINKVGEEGYFGKPDRSGGFYYQRNCPICLALGTKIATPNGDILVQDLKEGMTVWSENSKGQKIASKLIKVSSVPVPSTHQVIHLVLEDKRELYVSPGHPTANGLTSDLLKKGDKYDGSTIVSADRVPYNDKKTYDLLPDSDTGFYWANGILMGSTLKGQVKGVTTLAQAQPQPTTVMYSYESCKTNSDCPYGLVCKDTCGVNDTDPTCHLPACVAESGSCIQFTTNACRFEYSDGRWCDQENTPSPGGCPKAPTHQVCKDFANSCDVPQNQGWVIESPTGDFKSQVQYCTGLGGRWDFEKNKCLAPTRSNPSQSQSGKDFFIQFWLPNTGFDNDKGIVTLSGGVAGSGLKTVPPNKPIMATIVFKAKKAGEAKIDFTDESLILRHSDSVNILTAKNGLDITIGDQSAPVVKGDIDGDGAVGYSDFSVLLSKWGTDDLKADLNGDGKVGIFDFSILLTNWTAKRS